MDTLPYADESLPGGCTPRMIDEDQGGEEELGWDLYDVPCDNDDPPEDWS